VRRVPSTGGVELMVHELPERRAGVGTAASMVLAHATGFHGLVWRPFVAQLPGADAVAPDFRGHGGSSAPAGGAYAWEGFADDLLCVVDAYAVERPVGVGHSKGGAALLLAEQRRPGTFRALYLYEPVVFPPDVRAVRGDGPLAVGARHRRDRFPDRRAAYDHFAAKPPLSALHPEALWAYVEHGFVEDGDEVRLALPGAEEAEVYLMGGAHDAFEHLGEVTCPVTVAVGGIVDTGPAAFAGRIAEALRRGRLVQFAELGHFGPLERPALVAASVREAFGSG
jgi:pimeloyl-ACP methyl ester carboxylesterase